MIAKDLNEFIFKNHYEQFGFINKDRLFEKSEKFRQFNFRQNFWIEFTKNDRT